MILETERLILCRYNRRYINDEFEILSDKLPSCFSDLKVHNVEDLTKLIENKINDEFFYIIVLKSNNKMIGELFGALEEDLETFSPCWLLNKNYEGKGYAFEAVNLYFNYLFNYRNIRRIYAYVETDNVKSQNLCKRINMRLEGVFKEFISFKKDNFGRKIYEDTMEFAILKSEFNTFYTGK